MAIANPISKTEIAPSDYPSDQEILALLEGEHYIWGDGTGNLELSYSFTSYDTFVLDTAYWDSFSYYSPDLISGGLETMLNQGLLDPYFPEFTSEEKEVVRDILDAWGDACNIDFLEIDEFVSGNYGEIRFFQMDFYKLEELFPGYIDGAAGFAFLPYYEYFDDELEGDVFLDSYYDPGDGFFEHLVAHEIGHALGLAHPHDGHMDIPLDISESVMSYDEHLFISATPMGADIAAMEFVYGSSTPNPGDDSYTWTDYELNTYRFSLNDGDGVDTIDLSNWDTGSAINMAPDSWSAFSTSTYEGTEAWSYEYGQLYIDDTTLIENLVATSASDIIYDNSTSNNIDAGGGDDTIYISSGGNIIDGGDGTDYLNLVGDQSAYDIEMVNSNSARYQITNNSNAQVNTLQNVEYINFLNNDGTTNDSISVSDWFDTPQTASWSPFAEYDEETSSLSISFYDVSVNYGDTGVVANIDVLGHESPYGYLEPGLVKLPDGSSLNLNNLYTEFGISPEIIDNVFIMGTLGNDYVYEMSLDGYGIEWSPGDDVYLNGIDTNNSSEYYSFLGYSSPEPLTVSVNDNGQYIVTSQAGTITLQYVDLVAGSYFSDLTGADNFFETFDGYGGNDIITTGDGPDDIEIWLSDYQESEQVIITDYQVGIDEASSDLIYINDAIFNIENSDFGANSLSSYIAGENTFISVNAGDYANQDLIRLNGEFVFDTIYINDGYASLYFKVSEILSENEVGPITDNNSTSNEVSEDASIGDVVGITAYAEDLDIADSVSYTLSNDAGGLFAISSQSGVVTLSGALDYETSTSHVISVLASSTDGSESTADFTIGVIDDSSDNDDYDISSIVDTDSTSNELSEDASIGDVVGITTYAEDLDVADSVSYTLSNDAGGLFAIDSQSGVVTLSGQLDYESTTSHTITVLASSTDGSESTADFAIDVLDDVSDNDTPSSSENEHSISYTINNTDNDKIDGQTVTFNVTASGSKYYINGVLQDSLKLDAGNTYIFDYSAASNHPLLLSTSLDGLHGGGGIYTDGVSTQAVINFKSKFVRKRRNYFIFVYITEEWVVVQKYILMFWKYQRVDP